MSLTETRTSSNLGQKGNSIASDVVLSNHGERCVPSLTPFKYLAGHYARYGYACQHVAGETVLDVACGSGYGTAALVAAGCKDAMGLDIDPRAVSHARRAYGVNADVGDCARTRFDGGHFSLVVSFETIEHVPDSVAFLREVHRVLSNGGRLILSTPNATVRSVNNPHHVKEWTRDEILRLVAGEFDVEDERWQRLHRWRGGNWVRVDGAKWRRAVGVASRGLLGIERRWRRDPVRSILGFPRLCAALTFQSGATLSTPRLDDPNLQPEFFIFRLRNR